jgi:hypothetical protein
VDLFIHACQGLGLALSIGTLAGALAGSREHAGSVTPALALVAAVGGAAVFGWRLTEADADHPAWPGWPVGALAAMLAFTVARGIVSGARERAGEHSPPSAYAAPVVAAALVLAALSYFLGPIALVALVAFLWMWIQRRRLADRKHEGLRILR